jgi:dihydrofolate reductase
MRVSLIVALAANRVIGLDGGMPWHLSGDLKFFRRTTMGHPVVMGRRTYEAIGGALPGRANIVVTRNKEFTAADADVVHDVAAALTKATALAEIEGADEVFVIGGADIYRQALARADRIYMTEVEGEFPGDAFFPDVDRRQWRETTRDGHPPEAPGGPAYSFVILDRIR